MPSEVSAIASPDDEVKIANEGDGAPLNPPLRMDPALKERIMKQVSDRSNFKARKLDISHWYYVKVLILFGILQVIGIIFFTKGFLLSRPVLDDISTCDKGNCFGVPQFDKTVIIVIDALRFDFVIPNLDSNELYHNNFPILHDLAENYQQNSLLLKFIADPPTTTLQRLKGLTTGSLPTFIDAGSNFDGDLIEEDNWVKQLYLNNRRTAFVGDDTWHALFNPYLHPNLTYPYESLNVWDLHTVDNGVIDHFERLLGKDSKKWDVLIGHLLGVDHAGHRYGPDHFAMRQKLIQMNEFISDVISKIDDDTLLIVFGDHGMDSTGNHGGESKDELESTLFMYSKKPFFARLPDEDLTYNTTNSGESYRSVDQIDLVPTFSMLMGLPIPFNNLGYPIEECFSKDNIAFQRASYLTLKQIHNYILESSLQESDELNEIYQQVERKFEQNDSQLSKETLKYQKLNLEKCKDLWARFDLTSISIGISLILISLLLTFTYSKLIPNVVVSQLNDQFFTVGILSMFIGITITNSITFVLRPEHLNFIWASVLGVAVGIIIGILVPIMDRYSIPWLSSRISENIFDGGWSIVSCVFITIHCILFTSNSFTIWEDKIVSFLITTFGFLALFKFIQRSHNSNLTKVLGIYNSLLFIICQRAASSIQICREEQQQYCQSTFKLNWWAVALLYFSAFFLPLSIKAFYEISQSFQTAAALWITTGLRSLMFLIAVYWNLELIEHNDQLSQFLSMPVIKFCKFTISRTVLGIALVAANISWSFGPICIKLELSSKMDRNNKGAYILGYGNVYGSTYFLFIINFLAAVLMVSKPMAGLSIFLLITQIMALLEISDLLKLKNHSIVIVVLSLLAYSHFFTSGHQATLQAIQWDIAFLISDKIRFPFTHLTIVLNTFGSFIICGLAVAVVAIYKVPPSPKPTTLIAKVNENLAFYNFITLTITLSSFIMTSHFRRHLMVWKIFAPRFMFNAMVLIVVNTVNVISCIATGKIIKKINKIFGR